MLSRNALRLIFTVVIGCAPLPWIQCHAREGSTEALHYPEQVTKRVLRDDDAERLFSDPKQLEVRTGDPVVTADRVRLTALVTNTQARAFSLVVRPLGGKPPCGGDNPFMLRFGDESRATVTYSGELHPPEPPLPLLIEVPASGRIQFQAEINLRDYSYRGSPWVTLDWSFHYLRGAIPQGQKRVRLPPR